MRTLLLICLTATAIRANDDVRTWLAGKTLAQAAQERLAAEAAAKPTPTPVRRSDDPFAGEELTRIAATAPAGDEPEADIASDTAASARFVLTLFAEEPAGTEAQDASSVAPAKAVVDPAWGEVLRTARNDYERMVLALLLTASNRLEKRYGIPAAATVAMAIHESNYGRSGLTRSGHNWFGLKALLGENAVEMPTKELGRMVRARFRAFEDTMAGLDGFGRFLRRFPRYRKAFELQNPREFIAALLRAGYCPEPDYLRCIDEIMARHSLSGL